MQRMRAQTSGGKRCAHRCALARMSLCDARVGAAARFAYRWHARIRVHRGRGVYALYSDVCSTTTGLIRARAVDGGARVRGAREH
jgi:hypothetical protein